MRLLLEAVKTASNVSVAESVLQGHSDERKLQNEGKTVTSMFERGRRDSVSGIREPHGTPEPGLLLQNFESRFPRNCGKSPERETAAGVDECVPESGRPAACPQPSVNMAAQKITIGASPSPVIRGTP